MERMNTIIGSGIYNLDTVVARDYPEGPQKQRTYNETVIFEGVGGTCGNVMCNLAYLGWHVMPQVRLDNSAQGLAMTAEMERLGCDTHFVSNAADGGTTLLRCTHKQDREGNHVMKPRATSPGSIYPKRKFLGQRDGSAQAFADALDFVPDVYFFDDPAVGHRIIARTLGKRGALVYFEPSSIETNSDLECVSLSDIVKFSDQNVPDVGFTDNHPDKLFVQTLGSKGLRFRLRGREWIHLEPVPVGKVVDWEGAGDWTTATFIAMLGRLGALKMASLTEDVVRTALMKAQEVAARSVEYMGARGITLAGEKIIDSLI